MKHDALLLALLSHRRPLFRQMRGEIAPSYDEVWRFDFRDSSSTRRIGVVGVLHDENREVECDIRWGTPQPPEEELEQWEYGVMLEFDKQVLLPRAANEDFEDAMNSHAGMPDR